MALLKEEKEDLIKKYGKNEKDTGNSKVQIALLTKRISNLTEHLKENSKDFANRRMLLKCVGQRKRLLRYLKGYDLKEYEYIIAQLEIRK